MIKKEQECALPDDYMRNSKVLERDSKPPDNFLLKLFNFYWDDVRYDRNVLFWVDFFQIQTT